MRSLAILLIVLTSNLWGESEIPLFSEPQAININKTTTVLFYLQFSEIPTAIAPAIFYGAGGKIIQLGRDGEEVVVGTFKHSMDIKGKVGVQAKVKVGPQKDQRYQFYAKIWNNRGWKQRTKTITLGSYSEHQTDQTIAKVGVGPATNSTIPRDECIKQGGKVFCYRCRSALFSNTKPIANIIRDQHSQKCTELCCK
jgi:hypothetical protein